MSKERRPQGFGKKQKYNEISRRNFLKAAAVVGGIVATGGVIALVNRQQRSETDSLYDQIAVPDFNLTDQDKEAFSKEGWFGQIVVKIPEDYFQVDQAKQRDYLAFATVRLVDDIALDMTNSKYLPFKQAGRIVRENSVPLNVPITKAGSIHKYASEYGMTGHGAILMTSRFGTQNNNWYSDLTTNMSILKPGQNVDFSFATRATWALTLVHEILGHRGMTARLVESNPSQGGTVDVIKVFNQSLPFQEPFAYAVQASATLPLLKLGAETNLSENFKEIANEWSKVNGDWKSDSWKEFIRKNTAQDVNMK